MALFRTAVYEILYAEDVPVSVAINEAVELSKRYDDPEAYTFLNGVLGAVVKNNKKIINRK
jgi:N utilization substance protein B